MHDQPEPTREEEEQVPEHQGEHEAMQFPGHENPPDVSEHDEEVDDA